jgi:hypothetical protein
MRIIDRFSSIIDFILRIQRNHGLEHATIHTLASRNPRTSIYGRSDGKGFFLYTALPKHEVEHAARLALERLRAGEKRLAIHPNCGTNLLTAGILSGAAAYLSIQGVDDKSTSKRIERLPLAIMSAVVGLIFAEPMGNFLQQHLTTNADPGSMQIAAVRQIRRGKNNLYRIITSN